MKPLPKFVPVIHVTTDAQALTEAAVAFQNGADGIFLIDHKRSANRLLETYALVRAANPRNWIGLNFLDLTPAAAVRKMPADADALWLDSAQGVLENDIAGRSYAIFAGAAFKYQPQPEDLVSAAQETAAKFDVVTTSGPGTGKAAEPEKLRVMKAAIGEKPLAIASGVTIENLAAHLPHIDCFMVATGIAATFDQLDPNKVREMADAIHQFSPKQKMDYLPTVKDVIYDLIGIPQEQIQLSSDLIKDIGMDSLDTVELVMAFEEEYDIDISDDDAEKIKTVADIVAYLETTLGA